MKILIVTDLYPLNNENISKALYYFAKEWQNQGHNVEVIRSNFIFNTLLRGRKIQKEGIFYNENIKIYNLNFHTPFWFNVFKKLPASFDIKNYDVIISHMPCGILMGSKLIKKNKIKFICAVHNSDITVLKSFKYIFFRNSMKKAYKNADKIAARSPVLKQKIENIIPEIKNKTFVAFSGIEEKSFQINNIKPFDKNIIKISTAASLLKRKNTDIIIKALKSLNRNYILTIMGEGKERKHLEKLVKEFNLSDKIHFTGQISREEVYSNLKNSDIFILLSDNETFGLVYLEAMAANNIIIAKKNDGIDGILKNGENAFLINPNEFELKECIEKICILKEDELNSIKNNINETIKKLTLSKAAKNYTDNIEQI